MPGHEPDGKPVSMTRIWPIKSAAILAAAAMIALASSALPSRAATRTSSPQGWHLNHVFGSFPFGQSFPTAWTPSLSAVTRTDAWVGWVGGGEDSGFQTLIRHWNGRAWANVPLPAQCGFCAQNFNVSASSASNMWIDAGVIYRWNGRSWQTPNAPSWVTADPGHIEAFSATNVWVFVLGANGNLAAHYNGRTWTKVTLPTNEVDISALSPTDIWGITDTGAGGPQVLVHWNGKRWSVVRLPKLVQRQFSHYEDQLVPLGPANVWVAREVLEKVGEPVTTTELLHWNGKKWSTVRPPALHSEILGMTQDGHGGLWASAFNLQVTAGNADSFYHLHAGHWTRYAIPLPAGGASMDIRDLAWIPGTQSVWAAGDYVAGTNNVLDYAVTYKYEP